MLRPVLHQVIGDARSERTTGNIPRAPRTVEDYLKKLTAMRREYAGVPSAEPLTTSFAWLGDIQTFAEWLTTRYTNKRTYAAHVNAVTAVLRWLPQYQPLYSYFSKLNQQAREQKEEMVLDNRMTEREQHVLKQWDVVTTHLKRRIKEAQGAGATRCTNKEKLMLLFLTTLHPRRIEDWRLLRHTDAATAGVDTTTNHIYETQNGAWEIVFHRYKTAHTHGTQRFTIPVVASVSETHIANNNNEALAKCMSQVKKGEFVFSKQGHPSQPRETSNLSAFVSGLLADAGLDGMTMNSLRHSFITSVLKSNPTMRQKQRVAYEMATSVAEMDRYFRVDL